MSESKASGTIILIDGLAGCGKTTVLAGMPGPRALLDTDVDGSRWLIEHFPHYSNTRAMDEARRQLMKWSDASDIASIGVDTWAYFWQIVAQQVLDNPGNTFRAWGAAKQSIRRLYDPLKRAKIAGKHVGLTAHTKDDIRVNEDGGKMEISKLGQKADTEAMLNDLLDVHLRMLVDFKSGKRWFETVKCRPQREWKPLLPKRIDIPEGESHLMYSRILEMIGHAPGSTASIDSEAEDASAQSAMASAAITQRRA